MAEQRLYDYTTQRETGDASNLFYGNVSKQLTRSELKTIFNAQDNGQLRAAFGSFDNYMKYMNERQDLIDDEILDPKWWEPEEAIIDPTQIPRELAMDDKALNDYIVGRQVEVAEGGYNEQALIQNLLYSKYTGAANGVWYNNDGDKFQWNGSSFVKTSKVDDHNWGKIVNEMAKDFIIGGMAGAVANSTINSLISLAQMQIQGIPIIGGSLPQGTISQVKDVIGAMNLTDAATWAKYVGEGGMDPSALSGVFTALSEFEAPDGEDQETETPDYTALEFYNSLFKGEVPEGYNFTEDKILVDDEGNPVEQNSILAQIWEFFKGLFEYDPDQSTTTGTVDDGEDDGNGTKPQAFDCSTVNRQQIPSATEATGCGPCIEGYQPNEFGDCVFVAEKEVCPAGQTYNDTLGICVDVLFTGKGEVCNMEDGTQGIRDENGVCYVPSTGPNGDGNGDGNGDNNGSTDSTELQENDPCDSTGDGVNDGTIDATGKCIPTVITSTPDPTPTAKCNDLRADNYGEEGECQYAEICLDPQADNYEEGGPCEYSNYVNDGGPSCRNVDCSQKPSTASFALVTWNQCCTRKVTTSTGTNTDDVDCNMVECENPRPAGAMGVVWDRCCTTTTPTPPPSTGGETDCTLVECESPRPDGDMGALWDKCCKTGTTPTPTTDTGGDSGTSSGGGLTAAAGAASMFTPFIGRLSYQAQPVPIATAPFQKDYSKDLDATINRLLSGRMPDNIA